MAPAAAGKRRPARGRAHSAALWLGLCSCPGLFVGCARDPATEEGLIGSWLLWDNWAKGVLRSALVGVVAASSSLAPLWACNNQGSMAEKALTTGLVLIPFPVAFAVFGAVFFLPLWPADGWVRGLRTGVVLGAGGPGLSSWLHGQGR
jgi:hypothetical protein